MANGNRDQIILFIQGKFIFYFLFIFEIFRIAQYATASTDSAAYIIGGFAKSQYTSTIAQYKNNKWLKIGDLNEKTYALSAIFHNGEHFIVGGWTDSGRLVHLFQII